MGAVTELFRIPIPTASILFDVMPRVMSTLIVDREDKSGLSSSRERLLMDRHLLFVLGRFIALFSGSSPSSRSRAFGLLNRCYLE